MSTTITINDSDLERHGIFVKIVRLVTVPLLNVLPSRWIKGMMKKSSHDAGVVVAKGSGRIQCLDGDFTFCNTNCGSSSL